MSATVKTRRPGVVSLDGVGWAVAAALYAAGMALMFRYSWLPGPSRSIGDSGDGAILIATLEHWFRVFTDQAADWLSPGWFWPAKRTLGLTDTYFLIAVPYAAFRALGNGPFGSYTGSVAVLAAAGFWGMVALTRRGGVPPAIGGAVAFVFAFGALPTFKIGHGQTYTVMLAPVLGLLLLSAWRARRGAVMAAWAAAAGLLFGLMAFTAPQTAWFLGFEACLACVVALCFARPSRAELAALGRRVRPAAVGSAAGLALGLVPILLVFGRGLGHRRSWSEALFYLPWFTDLLDVQPGNLLWYDLLHQVGIAGIPGRPDPEVMLGFTPVLAASALAGLFLLGRARRLAGPHPWDLAARTFLAVAFLGWLLTVNYGAVKPWRVVFDMVPGARGIRNPFRIQLASLFFLCLGLAHAAARALAVAAMRARPGLAAAVGAALALCVVEQVGPTPPVRNTWEAARWLLASHRPSFPCDAFYVLPPSAGSGLQWYEYQSDAMLLSQWIGVPTINGNSSWYPPGWAMAFPDRPEYPAQALAWIDAHGLRDRVCGVEPRTGHWEPGIQPLLRAASGS
jgi:hypothetical protein